MVCRQLRFRGGALGPSTVPAMHCDAGGAQSLGFGADRIELHTGRYCEARNAKERARELTRVVDAARAGGKLGLGVAAGHGLNYDNVEGIARIGEIDELNIGHAIVARAVLVGMDRAVRDMLALMRGD